MPPVLVHVAQNQALAEILKGMLAHSGIEAHVVSPGARRHLLPDEGWTQWDMNAECEVWIADEKDLERARVIVEECEHAPLVPAREEWRCPKCGRMIEPQFTACWKCGSSRRT